ncbi:MAG: bifunctional phosphoglucose/phosphomannose isomerase [Chitinophagales bacterium]|nr:bifunctional phosphoglucose/phosphomannose isomerase [Chitinophagales bacterium]
MMDNLIANFTKQMAEAIEIGKAVKLSPRHKEIRNVVVAGLGGSGIGANLVAELISAKMKLPFVVCKDYSLPEFADEHTLLIVSSYSGNTEETLHAMEDGIKRTCKIICITSGGSMVALAKKAALDVVIIPGGMPPRSCLAYSFIQQLFVLSYYNLIDDGFIVGIKEAISHLDKEEKRIIKQAKSIAKKINKKMIVLYSAANMEAVSMRWRQQLNENSKVLCWHHVIPEMNHNELVGWRAPGKYAVILLRNDTDYSRIQQRMNIAKNIISQYTPNIIEIYSKGDSFIEKSLFLIHLGDWVSYFLAEIRKVDPVEVNVIEYLKAELAN